jgi:hypothetical protein
MPPQISQLVARSVSGTTLSVEKSTLASQVRPAFEQRRDLEQ